MTDPVLSWAGIAQQAGAKWHVPASVLLGLIGVESGGHEGETSSTGAQGLTQFEPGTARSYGVDVTPGHARSQIEGAAHYLHDLGYSDKPGAAALALAKYNAGPGNPAAGAGYARNVLDRAKAYAHLNTTGATVPTSSPTPGTRPASTAPQDASSSDGVLTKDRRAGLTKGLLTVAIVAGGAGLAWIGTRDLSGAPS